jgi:primosomal replication protein N
MENEKMNYEAMNNNKVFLCGEVMTEPKFSHEIYGEGFYELVLGVDRLSEHKDLIPITISERLLIDKKIVKGNFISLKGQFRSYNKLVDNKSRLMLTVFVRELVESDVDMNPNVVELSGFICKAPIFRTTPFNREICDMLIAVNRAYNKSDYLPCIAWGRNARFIKSIPIGEHINIVGRIQSRDYVKKLEDGKEETRTAYEISISKISTQTAFAEDEIDVNNVGANN